MNKDKCVYSAECIKLLGYQINSGSLKPDPARIETLFKLLKSELADVSLGFIDEKEQFVVETDASNVALSAAIVEAVRKWSHFLEARCFKLITGQRLIAFMFDGKNHEKIKNAKILRWRIELPQFDYKIVYCAGEFNTAPDVLSQMYCAQILLNQLY